MSLAERLLWCLRAVVWSLLPTLTLIFCGATVSADEWQHTGLQACVVAAICVLLVIELNSGGVETLVAGDTMDRVSVLEVQRCCNGSLMPFCTAVSHQTMTTHSH